MSIRPLETRDRAAIVVGWNAKARDRDSCWSGASIADAGLLARLQEGCEFAVSESLGAIDGFLFWRKDSGEFIGVQAAHVGVYYALIVNWCDWLLARQIAVARCRVTARDTTPEWGWMSSLNRALSYRGCGYDPISVAGAQRIARSFWVEGDPSALRAAAVEELAKLAAEPPEPVTP